MDSRQTRYYRIRWRERIQLLGKIAERARSFCVSACVGSACLTVAACSQTVDHHPLSVDAYRETSLQETFDARFWGDELPPDLEEGVRKSASVLSARLPDAIDASPEAAPFQRLLAISGGGANGAFGAGVLAGWTQSGARVEFDVVTGVSTGAILAPFAFLGPDYDDTMLDIYSTGAREKVFEFTVLRGLLFGSAVADTTPLQRELEEHVTLDLIEAIAREHEKARNLFIITTYFDAHRPVVWDVGKIATGRDAKAVRLIRQIMLASAAIPAFFPPVPIEFAVDDRVFTELHVDGSLTRSVFAYPAQIEVAKLNDMMGLHFQREVYVIVNGNEELDYDPASTGVISIARRSINTLLQRQMKADVELIFRLCRRDGVKFGMIAIPESFEADGTIEFDQEYMKNLVDLGYAVGQTGKFWQERPRSVAPEE